MSIAKIIKNIAPFTTYILLGVTGTLTAGLVITGYRLNAQIESVAISNANVSLLKDSLSVNNKALIELKRQYAKKEVLIAQRDTINTSMNTELKLLQKELHNVQDVQNDKIKQDRFETDKNKKIKEIEGVQVNQANQTLNCLDSRVPNAVISILRKHKTD